MLGEGVEHCRNMHSKKTPRLGEGV